MPDQMAHRDFQDTTKLLQMFGLHEAEKIDLIIDGPYLFSLSRALGFNVDYGKLLSLISNHCYLHRAFFFTVSHPDPDHVSPVKPLMDWMEYNGYTVYEKIGRPYTMTSGDIGVRGSLAAEISAQIVDAAGHAMVDNIVVIAGDGDLTYAVDMAKKRNARVTLFSSVQTTPMIADSLRRECDHFVDLGQEACMAAISKSTFAARPRLAGLSPHSGNVQEIGSTQDAGSTQDNATFTVGPEPIVLPQNADQPPVAAQAPVAARITSAAPPVKAAPAARFVRPSPDNAIAQAMQRAAERRQARG